MTPEEVLRQLEKHEASCDKRYEQIQATLEKLDARFDKLDKKVNNGAWVAVIVILFMTPHTTTILEILGKLL
jgi:hypothetical protein